MHRRAGLLLDVAGAVVAAALAALALARDGGSLATLIGLVAVSLVLGRLAGSVVRVAVPLGLVGAGAWLALTTDVRGTLAVSGPFGYRNATAAFFVQAAIAGLMLGPAFRSVRMQTGAFLVGAVFAVWFASIAFQDAAAGGVTFLVAAAALLAFAGPSGARAAIVIPAVLVLAALAVTVIMGTTYEPGRVDPVTRALTERRVLLWHESLDLLVEHPAGVGPGRWKVASPTAIKDVDAHWSHNEFLQQGAELGWAGLVLTVLLLMWGFARLWAHPEPDAYVALGAASLAALGIHAAIDYVMHFPAIPLAAAVLVGSAQAMPRERDDSYA